MHFLSCWITVLRSAILTSLIVAATGCGQSQPIDRGPDATTLPSPSPAEASHSASPPSAPPPERLPVGEIAFVAHHDGNDDIYLLKTIGGEPVRLTTDPAPDGTPVWSPDGSMIAFTRGPMEDHDIWVMHADGSEARNVTNLAGDEIHPVWSPDGRWIAFSHFATTPVQAMPDTLLVAADGSGLRNLTENPEVNDQGPVWSPDGTQITFGSVGPDGMAVFVMQADGTNRRAITEGARATFPTDWSPDGAWIGYGQLNEFWQAFIVRPDGTDHRLLLDGRTSHGMRWSPDGARMLISTGGAQGHELYVLERDGTNPQMLVRPAPPDRKVTMFFAGLSWSPDGQSIAAIVRESDNPLEPAPGDLVVIAADGSTWTEITDEMFLTDGVAWRPADADTAAAGS